MCEIIGQVNVRFLLGLVVVMDTKMLGKNVMMEIQMKVMHVRVYAQLHDLFVKMEKLK
jgi:hypothetical protein